MAVGWRSSAVKISVILTRRLVCSLDPVSSWSTAGVMVAGITPSGSKVMFDKMNMSRGRIADPEEELTASPTFRRQMGRTNQPMQKEGRKRRENGVSYEQ